jgi:hypothetical protein
VTFGGSDFIREMFFGGSGFIRGVAFGGSGFIREMFFGGCGLKSAELLQDVVKLFNLINLHLTYIFTFNTIFLCTSNIS